MGNETDQAVVEKLSDIAQSLKKIAEGITVFKIAFFAALIALLAVIFKNFLI